jgi:hypothetical protein
MPDITSPLTNDTQEVKDLVLSFFLNFSKFEYTMKCVPGYSSNNNGRFEADWKKLKNYMSQNVPTDSVKVIVNKLKNKPPKKQKGPDKFVPFSYCCDWDFLITSLKTVRNNLFHGGKEQFDHTRDLELLRYCNEVISTLIEFGPEDLKQAFNQQIPNSLTELLRSCHSRESGNPLDALTRV